MNTYQPYSAHPNPLRMTKKINHSSNSPTVPGQEAQEEKIRSKFSFPVESNVKQLGENKGTIEY